MRPELAAVGDHGRTRTPRGGHVAATTATLLASQGQKGDNNAHLALRHHLRPLPSPLSLSRLCFVLASTAIAIVATELRSQRSPFSVTPTSDSF